MEIDKSKVGIKAIMIMVLFILIGLAFIGVIQNSYYDSQRRDIVNTDNTSDIFTCTSGQVNFTITCSTGAYTTFINLSNHTSGVLIPSSNYTINSIGSICLEEDKYNESQLRYSNNCYDINPDLSTASRGMMSLIPIIFLILVVIGVISYLFKKK